MQALTHELLHAKLLMSGFPWLDVPNNTPYNLLNYINHRLMYRDYEQMGLDLDKFYSNSAIPADEEFEKLIATGTENWSYRWFCNAVDEQILGSERYRHWREDLWPRVLEVFPGLHTTTRQIQEWFDRGDFAVPERFISSYSELARIMQRPPVPYGCWFRLEAGDGKPKRLLPSGLYTG